MRSAAAGQGMPSRPGSSKAAEEKSRREAEAAANSARILEEERARDAAFRQAVLQVCLDPRDSASGPK